MQPLAQAILDGNVSAVRALLDATPHAAAETSDSGRSMFELARHKGIAEIVVLLLCRRAPGSEGFTEYAQLLTEYVHETSDAWMCASWYSDIEYILWSLVVGETESHLFSDGHEPLSFSPEEAAEWRFLAERACGWPTFEGWADMATWLALYEARSR